MKKRRYSRRKKSYLPTNTVLIIVVVVSLLFWFFENRCKNTSYYRYAGGAKIIDGDTLEIEGETFRIEGIDAPERGQPCVKNEESYDCGMGAINHLEFLLIGTQVRCTKEKKDYWGRWVGVCTADGEDVGELMVRHGWAVAYRKYSKKYIDDEEFARKNRLGIWSKEFIPPYKWRRLKEK